MSCAEESGIVLKLILDISKRSPSGIGEKIRILGAGTDILSGLWLYLIKLIIYGCKNREADRQKCRKAGRKKSRKVLRGCKNNI